MLNVKKRSSRLTGALVVAVLAGAGVAGAPAHAVVGEDGIVTVDIAAISDFHGHIENAGALAAQVDGIRAANPDTVFVSNGDLVGGSAYASAIADDAPTLEIMNVMGLQYSSVGNHEFDKGRADLEDRIIPSANFPYLLANVSGVNTQKIRPYEIFNTPSGVKVAFVGTVTQTLPTLVSPTGIEGLTVTDPVAATDSVAAVLKDGDESNGEADIVVALMHEGDAVAKTVGPNVDAVVAGHTHIDANVTTASGAPVIEPGSYGKLLANLKIKYNPTTKKVVEASASNIAIGDYNKDKTVPINADIQGLVDKATAQAKVLGAKEIGSINGAAVRGTNKGSDSGANRGTESSAGNLIAEAFYQYSQKMERKGDFGIMNPGGVRADLDANGDGKVTLEESFTMQPFGNSFASVQLNATQIRTMLEQQFQPNSARPVLRLGLSKNISYIYDPQAEQGSKITQVTLNGKVLDLSDTSTLYTVVSNQFLLAGGDGFVVFKEDSVKATYQDTGLIDNEVFNDFLVANPNYSVDYSQRSVGVSGPRSVEAGKEAVFELSSLAMTNAKETNPETVTLSLGGVQVSSAIDATVTPNVDETGTARIAIQVGEWLAGPQTVRIVAGSTVAEFPVEVIPAASPAPRPNTFTEPGQGAVRTVNFGRATDEPLMGDWDGDGISTPGVRRGNLFLLTNGVDSTQAEISFTYGRAEDTPLVGDWNGDGKDTIGIKRGNALFLKNALSGGAADEVFTYGRADDTYIVGDYDGDGKDTLAVKRGNAFFVKNALVGGAADSTFTFGKASDIALAGDWNGDGTDTIAVIRGSHVYQREGNAVVAAQTAAGKAAYFSGVFFAGEQADTIAYRG